MVAKPEASDLRGVFPSLAWTRNSDSLLAAGLHRKDDNTKYGDKAPIYAWDAAGSGTRREAASEQYLHHSLTVLPDNRLFLISNWRNLVVLESDWRTQVAKKLPDGAWLGVASTEPSEDDRFRVSQDGRQVEFALSESLHRWVLFDVGQIGKDPGPLSRNASPQASLTDWTNQGAQFSRGSILGSAYWTLNGKPFKDASFEAEASLPTRTSGH